MYSTKIDEVIQNFDFKGELRSYDKYGSGHINDTYLVRFTEGNYILQRINHEIFKIPEQLQENIALVTEFIGDKIESQGGDRYRETLTLVKTMSGENFYRDSLGLYWRAYLFIDDAVSYNLVKNPDDFYQSALAFGNFQYQLSDFPVEKLHYTIPKFHHTPTRFENFVIAVNEDKKDRVKLVQEEIDFVLARKDFTSLLWDYHAEGKLPLRVTHNDTKLNNVLIDARTGEGLCVVDLDTVMPGFTLDDFGDSIRFGATTGAEDERDLSKVNFDLELYSVYVKGYLEGCQGKLTDLEIELFPEGAKMMTLECGIRFLMDYLEGDTYFKIAYDDHNLVRARTQFKLVADMEENWSAMKEVVEEYL
ncbi:MAG: aminoglycoside phosphotransferase family protein [Erysipelothrix sp.]